MLASAAHRVLRQAIKKVGGLDLHVGIWGRLGMSASGMAGPSTRGFFFARGGIRQGANSFEDPRQERGV